MFIGRYQHTIDPKGRVSIPARYRNELAQEDGNLVVVPQDQSLNVYPCAVWERVVGALNEQSQFDKRLRRVGRLWISRAREAELDGAGRILLPPDSRQQAGLAQDLTLVLPGRELLAIWDREWLERYERAHSSVVGRDFDLPSHVRRDQVTIPS